MGADNICQVANWIYKGTDEELDWNGSPVMELTWVIKKGKDSQTTLISSFHT